MKTFKIRIYIKEFLEVCGDSKTAKMITFSGIIENEYFKGKILSGGVDTQIFEEGQKPRVSARYMLEGTDHTGAKCKIFIENNGVIEEDGSVSTMPSIITNSKDLKWLECDIKKGHMEFDGNVLYAVFEAD